MLWVILAEFRQNPGFDGSHVFSYRNFELTLGNLSLVSTSRCFRNQNCGFLAVRTQLVAFSISKVCFSGAYQTATQSGRSSAHSHVFIVWVHTHPISKPSSLGLHRFFGLSPNHLGGSLNGESPSYGWLTSWKIPLNLGWWLGLPLWLRKPPVIVTIFLWDIIVSITHSFLYVISRNLHLQPAKLPHAAPPGPVGSLAHLQQAAGDGPGRGLAARLNLSV